MKGLALMLSILMLAGCETVRHLADQGNEASSPVRKAPRIETPAEPHWVSATGYAPISLQPGQTEQQKMLMAMRASRLRAYQELAGIIHGQYLYGTTRVEHMVLQSDSFKAAVAGIVRGARVVKSYPVQDDTYATVLEVDLNQVRRAWVHEEAR